MGYTVPASDATPVWDTLASKFREKAVIVYPQATSPGGDMYKRTVSRPLFKRSASKLAAADGGCEEL